MKEEKMLLEGIFAMIEEMREKPYRSEVSQTIPTVDLSGIETLIQNWKTQSLELTVNIEKSLTAKLDSISANTLPDHKIDRIIEILQQLPPKPQPQKHHHVIDMKSSKTVKYILLQWIIIFLFLGWSIWLADTNMRLKNNDLKYRYIKSVSSDNSFIHYLENVFEYDKDRKEIRNIRKKVKKYENDVKRRAEMIEAGKQND